MIIYSKLNTHTLICFAYNEKVVFNISDDKKKKSIAKQIILTNFL